MSRYVFITKYFKSHGIVKAELCYGDEDQREEDDCEGRCLWVKWPTFGGRLNFYVGRTCFRTFEQAVRQCEELRDKEIKSLERQIKKMREMKLFTVKTVEEMKK